MEVLILLMFISLVLVVAALVLFFRGVVAGDLEDGDRLSLLPLESEAKQTGPKTAQAREGVR